MNNEEYWGNRAAWNMHDQMEAAEKVADEIAEIYKKASMWLSYEAQAVFEKYMDKHKLSEEEARRLLETLQNKKSIQELLMKLKNGDSGESKKSLLTKLEAPAYRYRMERLQNLQDQLDQVMQDVYKIEKDFSTDFYTRLAKEVYYRSIFEIQKKTGLAFSFSQVTSGQIDQVLSMNWSGRHYSERIWRNTKQLAQILKEELLVNLLTGRTERETSELIMRRFGSGAMQARRLVRTESCFISGELTATAYEECGIARYQYLATLDLRTSKICRELDMRVFLLKDRKVGKNYPPMHPWCRSTTVSVISEEDLKRLTRSAYDPKTKRTIQVPANMNYAQWYKEYVEGDDAAKIQEKMVQNRSADRRQYEQYKKVLGKDMPDSLARFQVMKYNEPEKWNSIKMLFRRKNNQNTEFQSLKEPMQLRHVKKVLSDMGIDFGKTKIKIERNSELIGKGYFGWTNPDMREIQLYPDAFTSREELVKTLGHERIHLEQLRLFGPARDNGEAVYYEQGPRFSENYWWEEYRRNTNYDGK